MLTSENLRRSDARISLAEQWSAFVDTVGEERVRTAAKSVVAVLGPRDLAGGPFSTSDPARRSSLAGEPPASSGALVPRVRKPPCDAHEVATPFHSDRELARWNFATRSTPLISSGWASST